MCVRNSLNLINPMIQTRSAWYAHLLENPRAAMCIMNTLPPKLLVVNMIFHAIRTKILPGRPLSGNFWVHVSAAHGTYNNVFHVPAAETVDALRIAAQRALSELGPGWEGDYVGGVFEDSTFWVRIHHKTPHTDDVVSRYSGNWVRSDNYLGQSA